MRNLNSQEGVFKPILGIKIAPEAIPIQNEEHQNVQSRDKYLRKNYESQDALVTGKIVQLRGDSKIGEEEIEDLKIVANNRMMIIEWETEKGKCCLIRAHLSPDEYKIACDAHRDGKTISIKGKPEKL